MRQKLPLTRSWVTFLLFPVVQEIFFHLI
jgi:hypothetical protein